MRKDLLGLRHPFFVPVWRRVATVAVCFGWAVVELYGGSLGWAMFVAAIGAVAAWVFFVDWHLPEGDRDPD